MKYAVASVCVMFWLSGSALAAEPDHALQAGLDIAAQSARDDTLVPLSHGGPRLALAPRYFGDVGFGMVLSDGRLGMGYIRGGSGEEGFTATWGLRASLLFDMLESASSGLVVGPSLGWENETFLFGDWDDAHAYWIGAFWVGPRARAWWWLSERWRIDLDGQFGLFGLDSRPPAYRKRKQETSYNLGYFFALPTRDLQPAWITDVQVARACLDFIWTQTRSRVPTGFGLGTELGFLRASHPEPAFTVELSVRLSYTWGL